MRYLLGLTQLPFEQVQKQIIYVEGEYNEEVNRYIQGNYERIIKHFKSWGYDFCYMPYLAKELAESKSLRYYAPFSPKDFKPVVDIKSDFILKWMVNSQNRNNIKPSLLYYHPLSRLRDYQEAICQFRGITLLDSDYKKTDNLSNLLEEIHQALCYYDRQIPRFHYVGKDEADEFFNNLSEEKKARMRLLEEIAAEFRQNGVKCAMLDYFTHGQPKISPMRITKDYRIIISDKKIGLTAPKSLAVYLLWLNHGEGITYKELDYYTDELLEIYRLLKKRDVLDDKMTKSIIQLATTSDEVSWHINHIRSEFNAVFEEHVSRNYTIEGEQNEERTIKLPRNLVTWECEMPAPTPKHKAATHDRNWYYK